MVKNGLLTLSVNDSAASDAIEQSVLKDQVIARFSRELDFIIETP